MADPPSDCGLVGGDTVILLGHAGELPQLTRRYAATQEIVYRGAKMRIAD
jgi:hypothetical protein